MFALFAFAGCSNGAQPHVPAECGSETPPLTPTEILAIPYFNAPTIESPYDIRVRHFARVWDGQLLWVHRHSYNMDGESRDFYAYERKWLQEHPEYLNRRRRGGTCPVDLAQRVHSIRVVTSVAEIELGMIGYTECFFYSNYLVVIDFSMGHSSRVEMVYRVKANGTIVVRPLISRSDFHTHHPYGTVVIELDNRFQPPEFNIEFICNPWGPSCPSAVFDIPYTPDAAYDGYIFRLIYAAVIPPLENTNIQRFPFAPMEWNMFRGETLQDIIDFIAPEYIMYIERDYIIFRDPFPWHDDSLPTPAPECEISQNDQEHDYPKCPWSLYLPEPTHCIAITDSLVFEMVAIGGHHTLALKDDGTVWAWGSNLDGQLGDGTTRNTRIAPVQVHGLYNAVSIAAGLHHSIALTCDGMVWAWGWNDFGRLGDGTRQSRATPVQVRGLYNVVSVATSNAHSVALRSDGTVWAWGWNIHGQLGDGTWTSSDTPVQAQGLDNVISVAAGWGHSIALRSDGTVWAWGAGWNGQLGDGTAECSNTPVQVQGLANVVAVTAGDSYSVALRDDGTVWAWGWNSNGQLGDGTTESSNMPVQVQGLTDIAAVAAGSSHSIALRADGAVWAWGWNHNGQLGDGTLTSRTIPVQTLDLSNVISVAAGLNTSIVLMSDGTVWGWGHNNLAQLGIGATISRHIP